MMQAVIILLLILAVLLVIFTLQNSMDITISVFFWEITNAPLVLVLICCIIIGYVIAALYFYPRIWKLKREKSQLNRELKKSAPQANPKNEEDSHPEGIELDSDESGSFFDE